MGTVQRDVQRLGPQLYNGIGKDSLAFKLMASMGWKEGEGLGASRQGIKEHLKVKKKFDTLGMGAAESMDRSKEWTAGMWTYDKVLSGLKEVTAKHQTAAADSDSSSSSSSDSDSSSSPGGSSGEESDSDTSSPAPTVTASGRSRVASHVGRYQKRERAKLVKGYSAQDLAAILGAAPSTAAASPSLKAISAGRPPSVTPSESEKSESESAASSSDSASSSSESEEEERPTTTAKAAGKAGGGAKESAGEDAVAETITEKAWWTNYFVRGGRVGDGKAPRRRKGEAAGTDKKRKITVNGFLEQDQEDLYHRVQDAATHGKQGLGRSSMPKKVAGERWCGKKTRLASSSDEDEASDVTRDSNDEVGLSDDESDEQPTRVTVLAPKSATATGAPAAATSQPAQLPATTSQPQPTQPATTKAAKAPSQPVEEEAEGQQKQPEKKRKKKKGDKSEDTEGPGSESAAASDGAKKDKKRKKKQQGSQDGVSDGEQGGAEPAAAGDAKKQKKKRKGEEQGVSEPASEDGVAEAEAVAKKQKKKQRRCSGAAGASSEAAGSGEEAAGGSKKRKKKQAAAGSSAGEETEGGKSGAETDGTGQKKQKKKDKKKAKTAA